MEKKVISYGNNGCERLCWVRLRGPSYNVYVICVYMPHRARVKPCQNDVLRQLHAALRKVPKGDCVIVMGDFNEELPKNVANHTGTHTCSLDGSRNSGKMVGLMRTHDLFAVNTKFRKRRKSPATYLQVQNDQNSTRNGQSTMSFVGRNVKTRWRGKEIYGKVVIQVNSHE